MESTLISKFVAKAFKKRQESNDKVTNLAKGKINTEYIIKDINTKDEEIKNFLFTLGCYQGELVTVISILSENYIISVKDARYSIDKELAEAIVI